MRFRTFFVRFRTLTTTEMLKSDFLDKSLFGKLFIDSSLFMSFPLFFFQYVFHNIECVNIANFHNINIENSVI